MDEKTKLDRAFSAAMTFFIAVAIGSIITVPFWLVVISKQLDRIDTLIFIAAACNAGSTMDACEKLGR